MSAWNMLTVIGEDHPGIVANVTKALYEANCNLGEASMLRLGGNFTIMLMVKYDGTDEALQDLLAGKLQGYRVHVDPVQAALHQHVVPDVLIHVNGADRPGIVSQVAGILAEQNVNILDLESDVGGTEDSPIYLMTIEAKLANGIEALNDALASKKLDLHVEIEPIEVMIG